MKRPDSDNVRVTMKRFIAIFVLCVFCRTAAADGVAGQLSGGRSLLLGGKYAEAAEIFSPLAKEKPAAAVGLARCLVAEGKLAEARKVLEAGGDHTDVLAELARLAFARGDYKAAQGHVQRALKQDANQLLALWISAELDRVAGRLDQADRGYHRLITFYNGNDISRAESVRWIGLAAARYARWNRLDGQFNFLVNDLYPEALELEPSYWPARYESGLLFLEKYNKPDAEEELQAALELNANAAEVHVALARLAMEKRDVERAEKLIDRALHINPKLLDAWLGKADLAWSNFKVKEAMRLLEEKALPLNPVSEETLGRLAACFILQDGMPRAGRKSRFMQLAGEIARRNPHAGDFYFTIGAMLDSRNKEAEAERFYLEAIKQMPRMVGPRSHLGLLYMQTGLEDEARRWLAKAFEADPFNVRVNNMLGVLEVLDELQTIETEHLIIKYDSKRDKLLAERAAAYLEKVYPQLCDQFGYRPPGKPLIEVFNTTRGASGHAWFSTRMIGLPYLGTVAACTGRMVAMASPNDAGTSSNFNWARVFRHELVHVITLQQTNFNIPHWHTEGLAVYSEGNPRPQLWNELLLKRVDTGELFNLQTINPGFTRPHSSEDWQMAYCQAELYVEFMLSRWGTRGQRRLLDAYAKGLTTVKAIPLVLGISQEEFERQYLAYLKELTAGMSALKHPGSEGFAELLEKHEEDPEDAELAAELAYAYLARGAHDEALELARAVLKKQARHQLATYVVARLRMKDGKTREAAELLEASLDHENPEPMALNLLAGLKLKAEDYGQAARLYSLGQRFDSVNLKWTRSLARVYLLAENDLKLAEILRRLARADADDLTSRKKLAQIALQGPDYDTASRRASRAQRVAVS